MPGFEVAYLAHPRRSLVARGTETDRTWLVEDESKRTPDQSRHRALFLIEILDAAGFRTIAPLVALSQDIAGRFHRRHVVAALERFTEDGRPRVRVRIEDRSPADQQVDWRAVTYVMAADDLYAVQSERSKVGLGIRWTPPAA